MKLLQHKSLLLCLMALFLAFSTSCSDDEPDRDKFLGAFSAIETCGGGNDTYDITILESGSGENAIIINNLYDWDESASATVSGSSVTIPSQLLDGLTFSGSGTISDNTLTINFVVSNGTDSDSCNAICTRK